LKRSDLIFDVGAHRGEDTAHYLARGFQVVAVEANPALAEEMSARFAGDVRAGRLTIVSAAIAAQAGKATLSVCDDFTVWSSLDPGYISRNETLRGAMYRTVEVPAVRFADLLVEFGVPHYLKVDIEGADMLCVRALHEMPERPDYLSIESRVTARGPSIVPIIDEFAELWTLGYKSFKFIDQTLFSGQGDGDVSGPFGEQTPGRWLSFSPALARAAVIRLGFDLVGFGGRWAEAPMGRALKRVANDVLRRPERWYDLHAKLGEAG
jgi:FkbM family methyltransferase